VWIVWYMDAQTAVRIHTDNSPETTHLSVWIPTDNNTIQKHQLITEFPEIMVKRKGTTGVWRVMFDAVIKV